MEWLPVVFMILGVAALVIKHLRLARIDRETSAQRERISRRRALRLARDRSH